MATVSGERGVRMKQADREIINLLEQIAAGGGGAESDPLALKIANNLSDLENAGTARTNLGLVPGADVQAYNVNLDTWAGLAPSVNGQSLVTAANYAAMRALLDLEVGVDVQAFDADLSVWAGLTPSANAQSLVTAADYAAMRTLLGLVIGTNVQAFDADLATWAGITPGTGVEAALAINVGSAGAFVTFNGALGTPSSGTLTNVTGLPVATGISGLGTGVATFLATPSSANLLAALTTKTGTGLSVFDTSPTIVTPVINGLPTGTGVAVAATASTLVARDANGDITTRDLITGVGRSVILRSGVALSSSATSLLNFTGALVGQVQALSGAGAINLTTPSTAFTSTGAAQALTLADGVAGQTKVIAHIVDGGSGVLTPTTKTGYTTITFNNAGDAVTLQFFTGAGWCIAGLFGAVAA